MRGLSRLLPQIFRHFPEQKMPHIHINAIKNIIKSNKKKRVSAKKKKEKTVEKKIFRSNSPFLNVWWGRTFNSTSLCLRMLLFALKKLAALHNRKQLA